MVETRAQARSRAGGLAQASASAGPQNVAPQKQARSKAPSKNQPTSKAPAKSRSKDGAAQKSRSKRKAPGKGRSKTKTAGKNGSKGKTTSKTKGAEKEKPAPSGDAQQTQGSAVDPPARTSGNDLIPSPTISNGPEFEKPVRAPTEAIAAARSKVRTDLGKGFKNPGRLCYRNATIVMLLHSNRFMSWIENRHIPNLTEAGLRVKPYSKSLIDALLGLGCEDEQSNDEAATSSPNDYTDVWCELFQLSRVYWDESHNQPSTLNAAMDIFWNYVTDPHRDKEMRNTTTVVDNRFTTKMKEAKEDQCASEFLGWLITLSVEQLKYFTRKQVSRRRHRLEQATLDKVVDLIHVTIYELVRVTQTQRARCMQCGSQHNVRTRFSQLDEQTILSLSLAAPPNQHVPVTLEDCLAKNSRDDFEWRCPACSDGTAKPNPENQNGAKRNLWKKIYSPPEVLFVQLARFKMRRDRKGQLMLDRRGNIMWEKDATQVAIPEELDLTPFLERRGEAANVSAKYRLEAIVNHQGGKDQGHYVCYIHRGDSWYVFNDALKVKKISFQDILKHKGDFTPYELLYERIVRNEGDGEDGDHANALSGDGAGDDAGARNAGNEMDNSNKDGKDGGKQDRDGQAPAKGAQDGLQSSSAQLKVTTEKDPRAGQLFIDIRAGFGRYGITLPTFVLENYVPCSIDDNHAHFEMRLRDSDGQMGGIEGGGSFASRQVIEGAEYTPPIWLEPTLGSGLALDSMGERGVDYDGQQQFNRPLSADTELDPELLPDPPSHSPGQHPPQTYADDLDMLQNRNSNAPLAARRPGSDDGAPFLYQTPSVQAKLRQIFNHMELFYEEAVKQNLHSTIIPSYEAEIASLKDRVAEYEYLLEDEEYYVDDLLVYWRGREADLLGKRVEQMQQIAELQEQVRCLQEQKTMQYYNPRGGGIGLGIKDFNTMERGGMGKAGPGQKRTFDQVDQDVQEVGSEGWTRASPSKRTRITNATEVEVEVEVGGKEHLRDDPSYDSRDETELHYDSSGQRLYDEPEDQGDSEDEEDSLVDLYDEYGEDDDKHPDQKPNKEESPLPDYEDMVHDDEGYDASNETSPRQPASWWYTNYAARLASGHLPTTPTHATQHTSPKARSKPSPLQIKHSPGQGRVDGRVRTSPQYYQMGGGANNGYGYRVEFDEDRVPHYIRA